MGAGASIGNLLAQFGHKRRTPLKGWGCDSVSKVPAAQAQGSEFRSPEPAKKASVAVNICTLALGSGG